MQQAGDSGGAMQSGLSTQWDFAVTQAILKAYGDLVKDGMRNILNGVAEGPSRRHDGGRCRSGFFRHYRFQHRS